MKLHTTECSSTHLQQTLFCVMTKSFSLAPCTATVSSTRKLFCDHFTDGALLQHNTGKYSNMMNATFWSKKCTAALTGSCFGTTSRTVFSCSMIEESTVTQNECSSLVQEMQGYTHWNLFCCNKTQEGTVTHNECNSLVQEMQGYTHWNLFCCNKTQEGTVTHNECNSLVQEMQGYTHWRLFCDHFIAAALHKELQ